MNQRNRFIALTAIALISLLAALAAPLPAFADDGAPPDETPAVEETGETSSDPAEPVEDDPSVAEIIEQIPDGTELVVLDAEGQVVPLAAQEAADILAAGSDPIWCPTGVTPDPTDLLCTPGFTDMATLLLWLAFFQPTSDGTIWIEDAYDSSVDDAAATGFTIDGNSYTTWRNYALVIQGGWDGVTDSTTTTGTSEFNVPLKIINWLDAVTVSDVVVIDSAGTGLEVTTTGDIEVTEVTVDNNADDGARLDNTAGSGDVTVTDSDFGAFLGSGNGETGLDVDSTGDITLTSVGAYNNGYSGAYLENSAGTGDILVDSSDFSFNGTIGGAGLIVRSAGDITVQNVIANDNTLTGLQLNNSFGTGDVVVDTAVANSNGFLGDGPSSGGGVWVLSDGNITLQTFVANLNYRDGARLDNSAGSGDILVDTAVLSNNGASNGAGLVANASGDVTLQTVTANSNYLEGAYLNNVFGAGNLLVDTAVFSGNGASGIFGSGLEAYSFGNIGLEDVDASGNYLAGATLDNTGGTSGISVYTDSASATNFNGNGLWGLSAVSDHDISLVDVVANGNTFGDGAYLLNSSGTGNIYVYSDNSTTTSFSGNGGSGLYAISSGQISLTDVVANSNSSDGAYLDNSSGTGNIYVYTDNTANTLFNSNGSDGLYAVSNGLISLSDVYANGNFAGDGVYLDNSGASLGIYIYADNTTFTMFSGNGSDGLVATSTGSISLTDVLANSNGSNGAYLDSSASNGNIFVYADNLATTDFSGNGAFGLDVFSSGNVSLTDVQANGNTSGGVYINSSSGAGDILIDPSMFSGNGGDGLQVISQGDITLMDVQASGNGGNGAALDSSAGGGSVFIDPSVFDGNANYGLEIHSGGIIDLTDVQANGNGSSGAAMGTTRGISGVLLDQSTFDSNGDYGLQIFSRGSVFLTDVETDANGADGTYVAMLKCHGLGVDNSEFAGNSGYGLVVYSDEDPSLGTVTFGGNGAGDTLFVIANCRHQKGPPALPPLPLHVVLVAGGEGVGLDCVQFRGTILVLPNGDRISLPCPLGDQASLGRVEANDLPQILGHQYVFISSMDAQVTREGQPVSALDLAMTVDFVIPPEDGTAALVILHWTGSEWEELGGYITPDNFFETNANVTGLFVLVKRQ